MVSKYITLDAAVRVYTRGTTTVKNKYPFSKKKITFWHIFVVLHIVFLKL